MGEQNGFEPLTLGVRHKSTTPLSSQLSYCSKLGRCTNAAHRQAAMKRMSNDLIKLYPFR